MKPDLANVVTYLSQVDFLKSLYAQTYSLEVFKWYRQAGFAVHTLNFQLGEDVVKSFFCLDAMPTPHVCQLETRSKSKIKNRSKEMFWFDEIARAAKSAGVFKGPRNNVTRPMARETVERHFEQILGPDVEENLPKVCIEGRALDLLYRVSIMSESLMVPEFYNKVGKFEMLDRFESYKKGPFCAVNTTKALEYVSDSLGSIDRLDSGFGGRILSINSKKMGSTQR